MTEHDFCSSKQTGWRSNRADIWQDEQTLKKKTDVVLQTVPGAARWPNAPDVMYESLAELSMKMWSFPAAGGAETPSTVYRWVPEHLIVCWIHIFTYLISEDALCNTLNFNSVWLRRNVWAAVHTSSVKLPNLSLNNLQRWCNPNTDGLWIMKVPPCNQSIW